MTHSNCFVPDRQTVLCASRLSTVVVTVEVATHQTGGLLQPTDKSYNDYFSHSSCVAVGMKITVSHLTGPPFLSRLKHIK